MKSKVEFNDLSMGLKIPIVGAWVSTVLYLTGYLIGFFEGLIGYW